MTTPSGPQTSVKYTLTGPDGTVATFNESTDPNFVGYLTETTGLDSPEVIQNAENISGLDGGIHGNFFYGRRPITLAGSIINVKDAKERNEKETKLQQASNAMRADAVLEWTPEGGEAQSIKVRRAQPLRITGAWNKEFQLALVAEDPRIYSAVVSTASSSVGIAEGDATGAGGNAVCTVSSYEGVTNVYVANQTAGTISVFTRENGTGNLTLLETKACGAEPIAIEGGIERNVYVLNSSANTITKFTRDLVTGKLTTLGSAAATGEKPKAMVINEKTAVVINNKSNSITSFTRNTGTGELTFKETVTEATVLEGPEDVVGFYDYFYVISKGKQQVIVYKLGETTGIVTKVETLPVEANSNLTSIARTYPTNSITYERLLVIVGKEAITTFGVNRTTKKLKELKLLKEVGLGLKDVTTAQLKSGGTTYVYVTDTGSGGRVNQFSLNDETGQLTNVSTGSVAGSAFTAAGGIVCVHKPLDASLYVTASAHIKKYQIAQATGTLIPVYTASSCLNKGSMETFPIISVTTLTGAELVNPEIVNQTTKESLSLNLTINTAKTIVFDMFNRTITLLTPAEIPIEENGFQYLVPGASEWFSLGAGTSAISVGGAEFSGSVTFKVEWRSAWV